MKYIIHILFLITFSIIQPTWIEYVEVFGTKPNLFLVYVIIVCCYCEKKEGAILGFIFGLMLDFHIGNIIGINGILMMLLGLLITGFCKQVIRKNTLWITLLMVAVATLLYELIYYVIAFLGNLELKTVFKVLMPEILGCMIVAIPVYFIIKKVANGLWNDKGERIG